MDDETLTFEPVQTIVLDADETKVPATTPLKAVRRHRLWCCNGNPHEDGSNRSLDKLSTGCQTWHIGSSEVSAMAIHRGECFCGAVQVEVSGEPEGMGYCHCRSCRSWSGGPVNAFTLWKPEAVRITAGAEQVGMFQKTPVSQRQYCKKCGGHLMTNHPPLGLVDVYAATLPTLEFKPALHVNYAETVLRMRDGLPKFKDFPTDFGGSGEYVTE